MWQLQGILYGISNEEACPKAIAGVGHMKRSAKIDFALQAQFKRHAHEWYQEVWEVVS